MPNLIDKPQLQATAQVAKSYIRDQDIANVNTIINALQQSGGGGTLVLGNMVQDTGIEFDVMLKSDSNGNFIWVRDCDDVSEPAKFELRIYYTIE